jgi:hypothetical protein
MNYLDLDLLENPYGKRVGGGYDTVRVGSGGRLHIQGRDGGPLCMQGRKATDLRASTGRVVDCYRCIKILAMESNAPYIRRELTTAKGEKKSHFMVPGGRQGQLVADKKASPGGMDGVPTFKRGPKNHPTQPWMTKRVAMAKSYAERLSDEGVALPPYLLPPTPEETEAAQAFSYYESPKAKRRAAAARRRTGGAAASEVAQVANPYMVLSNPNGRVHGRQGSPYMTFGNPAQTEAQANAAEAMRLFHSGEAASLQEAWDLIRGGAARPRKRTPMERAVYRPRTGADNAQNAAKAMRLFHSGQASSLAEAWDMVKGTQRLANGRRR